MINKKILAASIAAAFTFSANAAIDLTKTSGVTGPISVASESIVSGGVIAAAAAIDFNVPVGLNLPITGADMYIRIDFGNAKIATGIVDDGDLTLATKLGVDIVTETVAVVGGGQVGDSYVVYSFANTATTANDSVLTLLFGTGAAPSGLTVTNASAPVNVSYKLYQNSDSLAALNGGAGEVKLTALDAVSFASGQDVAKSFVSNANTALVATQFTTFKADAAPAVIATGKVASMGTADLTVKTGPLSAVTGVQVVEANVFTTPTTTATVTGDFSFGKTWHMSALQTCATAASASNTLVIAADKASATVPSLDYTSGQTLCVAVDGTEIIPRNTAGYAFALAANAGVAGSLGSINYDTTAITVPYLTTFSGYNQRVYILNNSSVVAPYSTTFQTEAGVTATAGTMATGTVPAKTMIAIKATDLVTFSGGTRGAAVIEIEATSGNVESTSQSVNKSDGGTDTTVLKVQ